MSIMSDFWIKEQCVTDDLYVADMPDGSLSIAKGVFRNNELQEYNEKATYPIRLATNMEKYQILGLPEPMIEPFEPSQVRRSQGPFKSKAEAYNSKVISYGTSSYGYDIRCATEFKVFTNVHSAIVDPKNFSPDAFVDMVGDSCIIPPNSFALARSVEYMRIPRDVLVVCLGKSTYARCGIIVNVTPLEPEWEGHITLEFSNTTPLPAKIYANEGCAQLLFFKGDRPCDESYKDRGGKYQGQLGVTLPRG